MLRIENITKQFGDKIAVDNLDMTVEDGSIMGLIGQNGAGKTTTFRMILDFIKSDSGLITWNGKAITQDVKQGIGFLPEERGLYQKMTVEEQILYFAELHGMKRDEARKELVTWMDKLEVVGKITDKVQTLSKGNAQKVQFIATLIHRPNFLILDEPFTGLDPVNTSLLMNEIKTLKENGAAIIFSSHNMSGVELLSDNLTMLKKVKLSYKVIFTGFEIVLVEPKSMWRVSSQIQHFQLLQVLKRLKNKAQVVSFIFQMKLLAMTFSKK